MSSVIPKAVQQFYDLSGNVVASGKLYSYEAGSTTPLDTFTDATGVTANDNPLILDAQGQAAIWIDIETGYKFTLKDSSDNDIWTVDNVFYISDSIVGKQQIVKGSVGTTQLATNPITTAKISLSVITTNLFADAAATTAKFASEAVTVEKIKSDIDLSSLNNSISANLTNISDLSGMLKSILPPLPWTAPEMLAQPATLPASEANDVQWSPDGRFLAVAHNTTPFVTIYETSGSVLKKLANPGTLPAGAGKAVAWSPNGNFLAVAHNTSPRMTVYQRKGNTFTKLSDPGTLPQSNGARCAFSPNGQYLAIQSVTVIPGGPIITVYQISGTTFEALSLVGGEVFVSWSPDSQYIATSDGQTNIIRLISVIDSTVSVVLNPPATPEFPSCGEWSPDGQMFVAGFGLTPYLKIWQYFKGSFTEITGPTDLPTGEVVGVSWSQDSSILSVAFQASPYIYVYKRSGTTFTKLSDPVTLVGSDPTAISFSTNGKYLSLGVTSTPFINTYATTGSYPSRMTLFGRSSINV